MFSEVGRPRAKAVCDLWCGASLIYRTAQPVQRAASFSRAAQAFNSNYRRLERSGSSSSNFGSGSWVGCDQKASSPVTFHAVFSNFNPVRLDLVVEGLAADAEAFGGFQFVAAGFLEHLDDGIALDAFQEREVRVLRLVTAASSFGDGEIGGVHFIAFRQEDGALNLILQLADVARPIERGQPLDRARRVSFQGAVGLSGEPL